MRRGSTPDDPRARERARAAMHAALDRGEDPERAAKAALAVTRECAEAWLLLADFATSREEARDRVRKAVEAATRSLGEAGLREGRGRLGETPDGAAYLHALAASARHQAAEGRAAQAIQTLFGLLAMDPSDPVPVRGDLLLLLLAEARDDEAEELVGRYAEEASADWMLGRALVRWRRAETPDAEARATEALDRAIASFPAAARALRETWPLVPGTSGQVVDPLLARAYAATEGALEWLRARIDSTGPLPPTPPVPPTPATATNADADRRFNAREIVEAARETTADRREGLARRALEAWPDCADAWRLLADLARSPAERAQRLREAVAAAARVLGLHPGANPKPAGEGEDARTYLEARAALADALRAVGDAEAALVEERRLLDEDPDDGLARAAAVAARLLAAGRDADAAEWLSRHEADAAPGWVWARTLARFRAGVTSAASLALAEAMTTAPLVAPLLFGRFEGFGDPERGSRDAWDEARAAAEALRPAWAATPGALDWLSERLPPVAARSRSAPGRGRDRT